MNASGQTYYLSLSGLELYGEVRGLADDDLGKESFKDMPFDNWNVCGWVWVLQGRQREKLNLL